MANNTTLRDGNGTLFTAESLDIGSGVQRSSMAANLRVGNTDVAAGNPVPVSDSQSAPVAGVTAITPSDSTTLTAGRGLGVIATVAGSVTVAFADASTIIVPVAPGYKQFPFAVTKLMATGTTATATYYILK